MICFGEPQCLRQKAADEAEIFAFVCGGLEGAGLWSVARFMPLNESREKSQHLAIIRFAFLGVCLDSPSVSMMMMMMMVMSERKYRQAKKNCLLKSQKMRSSRKLGENWK